MKRAKSSTRIQYDAEVALIQQKYGSLEDIRHRLDLSQRQFCRLLLVDPSTYNRWMKAGAPPSIWRSISWYLLLNEKDPLLLRYFGESKSADHQEFDQLKEEFQSKLKRLRQQFLIAQIATLFFMGVLAGIFL